MNEAVLLLSCKQNIGQLKKHKTEHIDSSTFTLLGAAAVKTPSVVPSTDLIFGMARKRQRPVRWIMGHCSIKEGLSLLLVMFGSH
jgi:hypothetical protein